MIPYNPQGLTPEEVAASRAAHGENIITPQRDDSAWRLLAEKFRDPIIIVLLVAAALSLAMAFMEGNFTETIGILCAILLATCVGFLFEWDAMRRFRRLNRVNDEQPVKVRRGGVMREIPRREVVVGDLVSLEAGETVPADGELVEAVSLQMDESTLTGEPETAKYVDEELFDPEATYPSNRLLRGTPETENMSVEEYESLGARFFGLIFKDATVYPAVRKKAAELGLPCVMLSEYQQAEAKEAGLVDAAMALCAERMAEPFRAPIVLMSSGENVVTVGAESGVGGRNKEYCTAAAVTIAGSRRIVFGAVDTDGTDGPGGFRYPGAPDCLAGAITDGETAQAAKQAGIDLEDALRTHGTSEPLWRLGCGVAAAANVSALDLRVILIQE